MAKSVKVPKKAVAVKARAPRGKKVVIRGLLEDKRPIQGPPIVTPTAENSRALNPERIYGGKKPRGRYGPHVDPQIEIRRLAEEAKAKEIADRMAENQRRFDAIQAADLEKARGRNTAGKAAAAALRERVRAEFVAASRRPGTDPPGPDLGPGPEQAGDYLPPNLRPRFERTLTQKMAPGGLAALAGLGLLKVKHAVDSNEAFREAGQDEELHRRQTVLADMAGLVRSQSLEASIQANLAEVQRQSPFLYNQVAAGRVLPQGAVVLGGRTRQDLLQELGRSMSEGQFSQ